MLRVALRRCCAGAPSCHLASLYLPPAFISTSNAARPSSPLHTRQQGASVYGLRCPGASRTLPNLCTPTTVAHFCSVRNTGVMPKLLRAAQAPSRASTRALSVPPSPRLRNTSARLPSPPAHITSPRTPRSSAHSVALTIFSLSAALSGSSSTLSMSALADLAARCTAVLRRVASAENNTLRGVAIAAVQPRMLLVPRMAAPAQGGGAPAVALGRPRVDGVLQERARHLYVAHLRGPMERRALQVVLRRRRRESSMRAPHNDAAVVPRPRPRSLCCPSLTLRTRWLISKSNEWSMSLTMKATFPFSAASNTSLGGAPVAAGANLAAERIDAAKSLIHACSLRLRGRSALLRAAHTPAIELAAFERVLQRILLWLHVQLSSLSSWRRPRCFC